MIKAKESQGLFDYTCEQTHTLGNGKFMNNQHTTSNSAERRLYTYAINKIGVSKYVFMGRCVSVSLYVVRASFF